MQLQISGECGGLGLHTQLLMRSFLSPLTGLDQGITMSIRGHSEPSLFIAGAELSGVHLLCDLPRPSSGFYHVGGAGLSLDEALIKALAESAERYSHFTYIAATRNDAIRESAMSLRKCPDRLIRSEKLSFFTPGQIETSPFPLCEFSPNMRLTWTKVCNLADGLPTLLPTQLLIVGYKPLEGEGWLLPAVTTGTAAHVTLEKAASNALFELIQIDSAMGHWFCRGPSYRIVLDSRTKTIAEIWRRIGRQSNAEITFFLLPNPDLPGFTIICLLDGMGSVPEMSVGLGCHSKLETAMYSSLLESLGSFQLSKLNLLKAADSKVEAGVDPSVIANLDDNLVYYSAGEGAKKLRARFQEAEVKTASSLPPDKEYTSAELLKSFVSANKEIYGMNLTSQEIRDTGLFVARVWSPDTISLCFPSYPPLSHPRFCAYGGVKTNDPHPYP
jgi:thiazole/oxazole-forming peptide maturase SagD family component